MIEQKHNEDASQRVPRQSGLGRELPRRGAPSPSTYCPYGLAGRARLLKRPLKALPYSRATRADTDGGASFSSAKRWRYTLRFSLTLST
jgi:hypothetical protein